MLYYTNNRRATNPPGVRSLFTFPNSSLLSPPLLPHLHYHPDQFSGCAPWCFSRICRHFGVAVSTTAEPAMALRGKFRPEATIAMGIDAFYLVLPLMLEGLKSLVYEMVRVAEMPGMKAEVLLKAVSKAKTQSPKKGRSKGYTKRGK